MPDDLAAAFNRQVTMELASAVGYLQMAAWFAGQNLTGMSSWMGKQSLEERIHADRFIEYVVDRGNEVRIGEQPAPNPTFTSASEAFAAALDQERAVTASIHDLYRMASDQGDLASYPILQAFIAEQNEEEGMVETILERIRMAEGNSGALLLLDAELAARPADGGAD